MTAEVTAGTSNVNTTGGPSSIPSKTFTLTTTAQVERTYTVQAKDEDQARARLRTHLADPDMLRDGVVVEQTAKQVDATPQRIKTAKP
jgi:hypothetical protein